MPQCKVCKNKARFKLWNFDLMDFDYFCDYHSKRWEKKRQRLTKEERDPFEDFEK